MKTIPSIGEYYHFWDDGKHSLSRHYICRCERIIPFNEFSETKMMRFDYEKRGLVEDTLLNLWKDSISDVDWIFAKQTDFAVVCSCPNTTRMNCTFSAPNPEDGSRQIGLQVGKREDWMWTEKYSGKL